MSNQNSKNVVDFMKKIKCKCGCDKLIIENRDSCHDCKYNYCSHYDDGICDIDARTCNGKNFKCEQFDSAAYDGNCDLCDYCNGSGCFLMICSKCKKIVEISPSTEI